MRDKPLTKKELRERDKKRGYRILGYTGKGVVIQLLPHVASILKQRE